MRNQLFTGNALECLEALRESSVHTVVTSPPFWGLRDYGGHRTWFDGEPRCTHDRKIVHEGHHPGQVAETKWKTPGAKGQASPTHSCSKCGAWEGQLGLEPSLDDYVRHLVEIFNEVQRVLRPDGTLWLNLGDTHFKAAQPPYRMKDLAGIPWRVALALQEHGWWLRSDIVWEKPNVKPEAVLDRPTRAHEYIFLFSKSPQYYYDTRVGRESRVNSLYETRNGRSVWQIPYAPHRGSHVAVFPPELPKRCLRIGTSAAGCCSQCGTPLVRSAEDPNVWGALCLCQADVVPCTVLDPFAGSGTTLAVAAYYGRSYIGIELFPEYRVEIEQRIQQAILQRFDNGDPEKSLTLEEMLEDLTPDAPVTIKEIENPKKVRARTRKAKAEAKAAEQGTDDGTPFWEA